MKQNTIKVEPKFNVGDLVQVRTKFGSASPHQDWSFGIVCDIMYYPNLYSYSYQIFVNEKLTNEWQTFIKKM